ncbi:MAG: hypothetical protein M3P39_08545, partial [Actinomycetota bacterium]|nr:hypothetical protein [Actinomycetota bacterium]
MAAVSGHLELLPSRQAGEPARWYAKWRDADGQHKRKLGLQWTGREDPPRGYLTRRDAQDELAELLIEARRHARAVYEGRVARVELGATFEEVATVWFRRAGGERPWKPATERGYRSMLWGGNPHVMAGFGSWRLGEITRRDVRAWWAELISPRREPRALSARDANGHLALFRTIFNWADCSDEYGPIADPSKGIPKCAEPAIGKADFFEVEEVYALSRAAEELHQACAADPERRERAGASRHDAAIILVAAFTGLRRGEV